MPYSTDFQASQYTQPPTALTFLFPTMAQAWAMVSCGTLSPMGTAPSLKHRLFGAIMPQQMLIFGLPQPP